MYIGIIAFLSFCSRKKYWFRHCNLLSTFLNLSQLVTDSVVLFFITLTSVAWKANLCCRMFPILSICDVSPKMKLRLCVLGRNLQT